uniref:Uncharacterized protein n=1 Tax=Chromera velia CCMP2878 TaxID=1169474 RepID=A0A0G4HFU1_9ALVE|eukprot:Cvel_27154.t1-p1 / transcript=Cvel_27154.t1 / gene=Cvel_27154 / organism=Chromera_velia_CCMP2878 / gene_product=hypothetical protein / transcript_product=hypothetical protein / location=Cvel_scaffold3342:12922-13500(-) / protein_length=193 / sequence_SO=supercontig / SO=protein_coding / is_pseudo=false
MQLSMPSCMILAALSELHALGREQKAHFRQVWVPAYPSPHQDLLSPAVPPSGGARLQEDSLSHAASALDTIAKAVAAGAQTVKAEKEKPEKKREELSAKREQLSEQRRTMEKRINDERAAAQSEHDQTVAALREELQQLKEQLLKLEVKDEVMADAEKSAQKVAEKIEALEKKCNRSPTWQRRLSLCNVPQRR